jgi:hypothetical protein
MVQVLGSRRRACRDEVMDQSKVAAQSFVAHWVLSASRKTTSLILGLTVMAFGRKAVRLSLSLNALG